MDTTPDKTMQSDLSVTAQIKLYYDLHIPAPTTPSVEAAATPPQAGGEPKPPLLIAVHGYGAHKRYMMREARVLAPDNWVIASLQAPHPHYRQTNDGYRVGFGWLSDDKPEDDVRLHHKFILDVVDKLDADAVIDRGRIYMFGFSQACALNFRFALTYPDVLRGIIGVCGGIPGDLETNTIYQPFAAETFYLYGDDDEFYTQEQFSIFNEKLAELLPNYRSKHYAAKHEITDEMREDVRSFLSASS